MDEDVDAAETVHIEVSVHGVKTVMVRWEHSFIERNMKGNHWTVEESKSAFDCLIKETAAACDREIGTVDAASFVGVIIGGYATSLVMDRCLPHSIFDEATFV